MQIRKWFQQARQIDDLTQQCRKHLGMSNAQFKRATEAEELNGKLRAELVKAGADRDRQQAQLLSLSLELQNAAGTIAGQRRLLDAHEAKRKPVKPKNLTEPPAAIGAVLGPKKVAKTVDKPETKKKEKR